MHAKWTQLTTETLADMRYALRGLRKAPGYAITTILTLALGLGALTGMLAVVDSVLLRPVPLPRSKELVMVSFRAHDGTASFLSYKELDNLARNTHLLSSVSGSYTMGRPITTPDGTRFGLETAVTPNLFQTLGTQPRFGRLLTEADRNQPTAVLSAAFWRDRLHSDPAAIGSTLRVSGQLRTVVGVLQDGLKFPQGLEAPTVFTAIKLNGADELFGDAAQVIARMKPGVSLPQARAEAQSLFNRTEPSISGEGRTLQMIPYATFLTGDTSGALWALLGGCGVMLLIACANTANLQIARASGRLSDMGVRSALGASFSRLVRQVAAESVVVSLLGAALGTALAYALVAFARHVYGGQLNRFDELVIHPEVIAACTLIAVFVGLLASIAPNLQVRRNTVATDTTLRSTRRSLIPGALVGLQIALTCVLLVTCGLFLRTFRALEDVPLGFDPTNVTTLVLAPENQHQDPEISRQQELTLLERFKTLPGVQSAAMQSSLPFSNWDVTLNGTTDVTGRAFHEDDAANYSFVSTDFLQASGLALRRGRSFTEADNAGSEKVVLVNEAFVKKFLPGRDPLSASLAFHRKPTDTDADMPVLGSLRIVGIVQNEIQGGDLGADFKPLVYMDIRQLPKGSMLTPVFSMFAEFAVRSPLPASVLDAELRSAIKQTAPNMSEMNLQSMSGAVQSSLWQRRLTLQLVSAFGAVALLLAAIGLYGVLTYAVTQRRKEIGIRMALGSSRAGAMALVLRHAARIIACGLVLGALATWPAQRAIKAFLFGVKALDPLTLAGVACVLLLICAIAAFIPAWRAAQMDPMDALRAE